LLWTIGLLILIVIFFPVFLDEWKARRRNKSARHSAYGSFITLPDGDVHYELSGPQDGPLVVFISGSGPPATIFDRAVKGLHESGYRTLRYDHYGRGYSSSPKGDYTIDFFQKQFTELLEALNISDPFFLVGHSFGCIIACSYVTQFPERVKKLILLSPSGFEENAKMLLLLIPIPTLCAWILKTVGAWPIRRVIKRAFYDKGEWSGFHEKNKTQLSMHGAIHAYLSFSVNYFKPVFRRKFRTIYQEVGKKDIPVIALCGKNDTFIPISCLGSLQSAIPHIEVYVLDKSAHALIYENANSALNIIRNFLNPQ
jgi:pimeloyl-ACP methyl ester carboxylesterase